MRQNLIYCKLKAVERFNYYHRYRKLKNNHKAKITSFFSSRLNEFAENYQRGKKCRDTATVPLLSCLMKVCVDNVHWMWSVAKVMRWKWFTCSTLPALTAFDNVSNKHISDEPRIMKQFESKPRALHTKKNERIKRFMDFIFILILHCWLSVRHTQSSYTAIFDVT